MNEKTSDSRSVIKWLRKQSKVFDTLSHITNTFF